MLLVFSCDLEVRQMHFFFFLSLIDCCYYSIKTKTNSGAIESYLVKGYGYSSYQIFEILEWYITLVFNVIKLQKKIHLSTCIVSFAIYTPP